MFKTVAIFGIFYNISQLKQETLFHLISSICFVSYTFKVHLSWRHPSSMERFFLIHSLNFVQLAIVEEESNIMTYLSISTIAILWLRMLAYLEYFKINESLSTCLLISFSRFDVPFFILWHLHSTYLVLQISNTSGRGIL